jgi:hypothetical protein
MKKQFLLSLIILLFCGIIYGQHHVRVNNNAGADADYTSLQAANDAANNGDTIYVEGSTTAYAGADISKKFIIIGPGYFLADNPKTQANALQATFNSFINFNTGSTGSSLTGIVIPSTYVSLFVNDIAITRCNINSLFFQVSCQNILISQNYLYYIGISGSGQANNSVISNNIISGNINLPGGGPVQITNNVMTSTSANTINVYNSNINNNIICSSTNIPTNTGNNITNNILAAAGTNANGNQYNVVMANVFVDYSGSLNYSDDGKWKLKPGSVAIGAGISGVDCGAFGGATPYVLSGVPNLPHIYEALIPGTAYSDAGLSCTIKIASGN